MNRFYLIDGCWKIDNYEIIVSDEEGDRFFYITYNRTIKTPNWSEYEFIESSIFPSKNGFMIVISTKNKNGSFEKIILNRTPKFAVEEIKKAKSGWFVGVEDNGNILLTSEKKPVYGGIVRW